MQSGIRGKESGFTLVELLVVIAIIGILIGMLMPAVQQVREAARRVGCSNNLRQSGLALHSYHSSFEEFPVGCDQWRPASSTTERQIAWSAKLLPHLEQQNVFDRLDFSLGFDATGNELAAATIISAFICPSGQRGRSRTDGRGPCDYGGIFGERINGPNNPPKGCMLHDQAISISEIRDGTSTTIIVAEDVDWPEGQWINGRNLFDQAFSINTAPAWENDIRSPHTGGANILLADGSVHFARETMDEFMLGAICTRAEGEIASLDP